MEIERQFLVPKLPALPDSYVQIEQGYIALEPEIRFRAINQERFYLTVKRGAGLAREEFEVEIRADEYANLKKRQLPNTILIQKRRYRIPLDDGYTAELFVHEGHLAGFNYVEVEFGSENEALLFVPPLWFGREVTDDIRFSYGALARKDGAEIVKSL